MHKISIETDTMIPKPAEVNGTLTITAHTDCLVPFVLIVIHIEFLAVPVCFHCLIQMESVQRGKKHSIDYIVGVSKLIMNIIIVIDVVFDVVSFHLLDFH